MIERFKYEEEPLKVEQILEIPIEEIFSRFEILTKNETIEFKHTKDISYITKKNNMKNLFLAEIFSTINKEMISHLKFHKLPNLKISFPEGSVQTRGRSNRIDFKLNRNVLEKDEMESPLMQSQRKFTNRSKFTKLVDSYDFSLEAQENHSKDINDSQQENN